MHASGKCEGGVIGLKQPDTGVYNGACQPCVVARDAGAQQCRAAVRINCCAMARSRRFCISA